MIFCLWSWRSNKKCFLFHRALIPSERKMLPHTSDQGTKDAAAIKPLQTPFAVGPEGAHGGDEGRGALSHPAMGTPRGDAG